MQVEVLLHQDMPESTLEEAQDVLPWARGLPALHAWCLQLLQPSKRDPQQGARRRSSFSWRSHRYEKLAASRYEPDSERKRFKRMDELDVRLMVKPGHSEQDGTTGFQPLLDAHGMSLANKQVNRELMTTLFSKNRFFLSVDDKHPYWVPGQFLRAIMAPNHLAQIKHLYIDVDTKLQPYEADYRKGVIVVNYSMHHIVKTLNSVGKGLKSLTVNHISCYAGEIEELRRFCCSSLEEQHRFKECRGSYP
ncbi:hypothetical protein D6C78_04307 [Aureobasidium pullulans]|uniref:Uncharacterized protein n=1 Tax=Aureobasidium pullulans TaxID=5580 RepID=A0A4T0BT58_AURPU|nr:hypothetical protein D6C78_04307 [Aureobasidium pullulans]